MEDGRAQEVWLTDRQGNRTLIKAPYVVAGPIMPGSLKPYSY